MIFTFDARDNILWEVMTDYFELTVPQIYTEIQHTFDELREVLRKKGIKYEDLKTALIPNIDKKEIVLVFDTSKINNTWYGYDVFEKIIPLFDDKSNHSVLTGDYIGDAKKQDFLYELFYENIKLVRNCDYIHNSQFYLIYINNITDAMLERFVEGLLLYEPFIGFFDVTFESKLKTYISFILPPCFIKHRKKIIMGHEDDVPNTENYNVMGYSFEENNYKCYSLQDSLYTTFLSYKIERYTYEGFKRDVTFSLNTISQDIHDLADLDLLVEEQKLQYLLSNKTGVFKKANMLDISKAELEGRIKAKLAENYIFNLDYLQESNTYKFNIVLQFNASDNIDKLKMMIALEYLPDEKKLRLITMY